MLNKTVFFSLFVTSLISHAIAVESNATDTQVFPLPISSQIDVNQDAPFSGADLSVYEPLDFVTNAVQVAPHPLSSSPRLVVANTIPDKQPESGIASIARGEISEPAPLPLTANLVPNLGWSLGAILLSSTLDKSGDQFARDHKQNSATKSLTKVGNALPFIAFGLAGLAALDADPRLSRTGMAALQAGGLSTLSGLGLKYVFSRARPEADLGPSQFHNASLKSGDSSLPSIHTAMSWGVITPFAKEYDMPWLYGVAALTNFSRVADRKHWISDTVAGSALGYWLGDLAWHYNRQDDRTGTQVYLGDRSIAFSWAFQ